MEERIPRPTVCAIAPRCGEVGDTSPGLLPDSCRASICCRRVWPIWALVSPPGGGFGAPASWNMKLPNRRSRYTRTVGGFGTGLWHLEHWPVGDVLSMSSRAGASVLTWELDTAVESLKAVLIDDVVVRWSPLWSVSDSLPLPSPAETLTLAPALSLSLTTFVIWVDSVLIEPWLADCMRVLVSVGLKALGSSDTGEAEVTIDGEPS